MNIKEELIKLKDDKNKEFLAPLIPTVDKSKILGIKLPILKNLSKKLSLEEKEMFIRDLPHKYYEENVLHVFVINDIKDYSMCIKEINNLLPYINSWSLTDSFKPKCVNKNKKIFLNEIDSWLDSKKVYTIRLGIKMLMSFYLKEDFNIKYMNKALNVSNDDYYVKMMKAWYIAEGLVKQYDTFIEIIENNRLEDTWVHNKAIQKANESFRIKEETKDYLKSLRRKNG